MCHLGMMTAKKFAKVLYSLYLKDNNSFQILKSCVTKALSFCFKKKTSGIEGRMTSATD